MDAGIGIGGFGLSKNEVVTSAFDLFSPIEIEYIIVKANKISVRPISSTSSRGPFKFVINPDPKKWTDIETLKLSGKVRGLKKVDNVLSDFDDTKNEISTVNNLFSSLFSSVTCQINSVELTDPSGNWYPYKLCLKRC